MSVLPLPLFFLPQPVLFLLLCSPLLPVYSSSLGQAELFQKKIQKAFLECLFEPAPGFCGQRRYGPGNRSFYHHCQVCFPSAQSVSPAPASVVPHARLRAGDVVPARERCGYPFPVHMHVPAIGLVCRNCNAPAHHSLKVRIVFQCRLSGCLADPYGFPCVEQVSVIAVRFLCLQ